VEDQGRGDERQRPRKCQIGLPLVAVGGIGEDRSVLLISVILAFPVLLVLLDLRRGHSLYDRLLEVQERYVRSRFEVETAKATGERLADQSDPELDVALRGFDRQQEELDQITRQTMAKVVWLAERPAAG
jgi:hypothetical protein